MLLPCLTGHRVTPAELAKKSLRSEGTQRVPFVFPPVSAANPLSIEVLRIFEFAASGTRIHPMSVLMGEDSKHIDNNVVITFLSSIVDVIVQKGTYTSVKPHDTKCHIDNHILAKKTRNERWGIPGLTMEKPGKFLTAATGVIHTDTGMAY